MVSGRFHNVGQPTGLGSEVEVDLYDMGTLEGAYGVFMVQRGGQPPIRSVSVGFSACHDPNAICFWKGKYFARVLTLEEDEAAKTRRIEFAMALFSRLEGSVNPPRWAKSFPENGLVEGSVRYNPVHVLGYEFLPAGFTADYKLGDQSAKAFIIDFPDYRLAVEGLSEWRKAVESDGREVREVELGIQGLWFVGDGQAGNVLVFRKWKRLLGVVGLDIKTSMKLARQLEEMISR